MLRLYRANGSFLNSPALAGGVGEARESLEPRFRAEFLRAGADRPSAAAGVGLPMSFTHFFFLHTPVKHPRQGKSYQTQ
jgi:hypothetical protein